MSNGEISNRFLSIEIILPFIIMGIGGLVGYGALSSDVEHKVDKEDFFVLQNEVEHIKEDTSEIKEEQKEQRNLLEQNHQLLLDMIRTMGDDE